ncbi:VOC family protein [Paraglaciecola aestuariivivens]
MSKAEVGSVSWFDLTVENAPQVRDFYQQVVGWQSEAVNMGDYDDYVMQSPDSKAAVAGVCHKKTVNQSLPSQWLMYIKVADLTQSIEQVVKGGGSVLTEIKHFSKTSRYVVIKDPAGAVCAIYDEAE